MSPKRAALGTFLVGFAYFCVVIYPLSTLNTWWWTTSSGFFWEYRGLVFFGVALFLAVICSGLTFAPVFFLYTKQLKKFPRLSIIILPFMWEALEILRVKILFGLEWAVLGHPLGKNLFFARSVAIGGIFILSSLVIVINYCLFLVIKNFIDQKLSNKSTVVRKKFGLQSFVTPLLAPLIALAVVCGALGFNNYNVAQNATRSVAPKKSVSDEKEILVATVSPHLKTIDITDQGAADYLFSLIFEATKKSPGLLILPENIFPFFILNEENQLPLNYKDSDFIKENFDRLLKISKDYPKTSFIIGFHTYKNKVRFNSAIVLEKGVIVSIYNKQELLPFTEKSFSFFETVHVDPLSRGNGDQRIETQYGNLTPLICSEILISGDDPWKTSDSLALINISNDNIFTSPRVATYNKISTRLRAIQTGQTVIRSAKGGFSGIFDKTGREITTETTMDGEIFFGTINIP